MSKNLFVATKNPEVDAYMVEGCGRCKLGGTPDCKVHQWQDQLAELRLIALESQLTEERKWGVPCYTYQKKVVLFVSAFKSYCVMSFFKGALMKDPHQILTKPGKNSQAIRQVRFTDVQQIVALKPTLESYIQEAIEIEKAGLKVDFHAKNALTYPEELVQKFQMNPALKTAFEALTLGRKRGYLLYFKAPKQSKTKEARIERYTQKILDGKGLQD